MSDQEKINACHHLSLADGVFLVIVTLLPQLCIIDVTLGFPEEVVPELIHLLDIVIHAGIIVVRAVRAVAQLCFYW